MRVSVGIIVVLLVLVGFEVAHAQTEQGLAASTDRQSYAPGERVVISGTVPQPTDNNPVTVIVRNPIGNVYEVGQVALTNNRFSHGFVLGNDAKEGIYTVNVRQGVSTAQIQFQVTPGQVVIIPVFDGKIRSTGEYADLVKYGSAQVSSPENSVTIPLDTSKIQNDTVPEEYHVPKHVIDSSYGSLVVKENGVVVNCVQTDASDERVLDCPINKGAYSLTIVGTSVIPEFGPLAAFALVAGLSAVVLSSRHAAISRIR